MPGVKYSFDWDIKPGTTVHSTTHLNVKVGDVISYSFYVYPYDGLSVAWDIGIGLWNNTNLSFYDVSDVGGYGSYTARDSWTMAIGGDFSFSIKSYNSFWKICKEIVYNNKTD